MRSTAKIGKAALRICGDVAVFQFGNQFTLVSFASVAEHLQSICLGYALAHKLLLACSQFNHFLFDGRQIALFDCHAIPRINVVIESVLNGRTDTELNARIKFLQSLCQQVRACMPESVLALLVFPFIKNEVGIFVYRTIQINRFAVHAAGQYILCQTRTDAFCNLQTGNSVIVFTDGAIRKSYLYHNVQYLSVIVYKII